MLYKETEKHKDKECRRKQLSQLALKRVVFRGTEGLWVSTLRRTAWVLASFQIQTLPSCRQGPKCPNSETTDDILTKTNQPKKK